MSNDKSHFHLTTKVTKRKIVLKFKYTGWSKKSDTPVLILQ